MRRLAVPIITVGIALALVTLVLVFAMVRSPIGRDNETPIASVLWIHAPTYAFSGTNAWDNFTLTLNQTIPLSDLYFEMYSSSRAVITPAGASLSVIDAGSPVGNWNFYTGVWESGATGRLVAGEWLSLTLPGQSLAGDYLAAIGAGQFSSTTSVTIP